MSLDHILLGMLRKRASGYDLKIEFNEGTRHFWSAELSQIYPTLKRLETRGLLKSVVEPSPRGPDRKVYKRTAAGRKELLKWLAAGPVMGTQRFAYVAQLACFDEFRDLGKTLDFMLDLHAKLTSFLGFLTQEEDTMTTEQTELSDEEFHHFLCLRMGVTSIRGRIEWCEESIAFIRQRQQSRSAEETAHD